MFALRSMYTVQTTVAVAVIQVWTSGTEGRVFPLGFLGLLWHEIFISVSLSYTWQEK